MSYQAGDTRVEAVDYELLKRQRILGELKDKVQNAQERMKKYADGKRKFWEFQVRDWVWVKLRPY